MNAFLSELGRKLAERWITLLVLPGALFTALAGAGLLLGQRDALGLRRLGRLAEGFAARYDHRPGAAVVLLCGVFAAGAVTGLLARGLGAAVEKVWLLAGPPWLTGRLVSRRQDRWARADAAARLAGPAEEAALVAARNAIALVPPARPTWIGDRLRGVGLRVHGQYGLDLAFTWPRLWPLLPEACRNDLIAARQAMADAATLGGWGLLYLCLGVQWWPAALGGVVLLLMGWGRGRDAAGNLADLTESAVDLYAADLARSLGAALPLGRVTPALGRQLSERFRKGA
ncbi:hypothetical protein GCM10010503_25760 [Streptomyces lucensis JCM 4490]|uniref:Uncharacterized protein n=1 Tax=Streptomyces lucensis JCM 4490 TaxID=1306176 RepID=A0A918J4J8_9ACTN|nr:hypothetical protein [Streptomyces lucensis]GGW47705.1 hypothetical protein GCM10010503_25760 [Streptomyces lucensis JCM 4490]